MNMSKVAILATDGFEESELRQPMEALKEKGADVDIVSLKEDTIKAWDQGNWSDEYPVDVALSNANSKDYDALVLPGGVINPDKLRRHDEAIHFVRDFFDQNKPVAAICHAGWMLAEADVVNGKRMTSYHSIKTDMINAGAKWENNEVVVHENMITSRSPADLDAFIGKLIEKIKENKHELQSA